MPFLQKTLCTHMHRYKYKFSRRHILDIVYLTDMTYIICSKITINTSVTLFCWTFWNCYKKPATYFAGDHFGGIISV